jgi:hypothetical protein
MSIQPNLAQVLGLCTSALLVASSIYHCVLHLPCLHSSHLCCYPHILLHGPLSPHLEYQLNYNISSDDLISNDLVVSSKHHLTWDLKNPDQILAILLSIVCPAITIPFETLSPFPHKNCSFMTRFITPLLFSPEACSDL